MKFRYARHTNNLKALINFYANIIGLIKLRSFENHSNYKDVFLDFPNLDWHIEFTELKEKVNHHLDEDNLMVFYFNSEEEINTITSKAKKSGMSFKNSKNPF